MIVLARNSPGTCPPEFKAKTFKKLRSLFTLPPGDSPAPVFNLKKMKNRRQHARDLTKLESDVEMTTTSFFHSEKYKKGQNWIIMWYLASYFKFLSFSEELKAKINQKSSISHYYPSYTNSFFMF